MAIVQDFRKGHRQKFQQQRDSGALGGKNEVTSKQEMDDIAKPTEDAAAMVSIRDWLNTMAEVDGGDAKADAIEAELFISWKKADVMSDSGYGSATKSVFGLENALTGNDDKLNSRWDTQSEKVETPQEVHCSQENCIQFSIANYFHDPRDPLSGMARNGMRASSSDAPHNACEMLSSGKVFEIEKSRVVTPLFPEIDKESENKRNGTETLDYRSLKTECPNFKPSLIHEISESAKIEQANSSLIQEPQYLSLPGTVDLRVEDTDEADVSMEVFDAATSVDRAIAAFKRRLMGAVILRCQNYTGRIVTFKGGTDEAAQTVSSDSSSAAHGTESESNNKAPQRGGDHKRRRDDEDDEADEDGLNPNPKKKGKSSRKIAIRRLACPYFQRNSEQCEVRSCSGPGYADVTILKKCHLSRHHKRPPQCPRCWECFKDDAAKEEHISEVCEKTPEPNDDRISNGVWAQMSGQNKFNEAASEEEKWSLMFKLIFPNDECIPSPYYSNNSQNIEDFETLCRTALPQLFVERLQQELEVYFNPIYRSLVTKVPSIIDDCLKQVFQMRRQPQATSDTDSAYRSTTSRSTLSPLPSPLDSFTAPVAQSMMEDWHNLFEFLDEPSSNMDTAETDQDENTDWGMS